MRTRMSTEAHTVYVERRIADREVTMHRQQERSNSWIVKGRAL